MHKGECSGDSGWCFWWSWQCSLLHKVPASQLPQRADSFATTLEGAGKWNSDRSAIKQIQPAALLLDQSSWHKLWMLKSALKASRVTYQKGGAHAVDG